ARKPRALGTPAGRQPWVNGENGTEPRRGDTIRWPRGTCSCRASGARHDVSTFPSASALGYPLDAPTGAVLGALLHPGSPKVSGSFNHSATPGYLRLTHRFT